MGGAYNQTNISLAGKLTVNIHNSKHSDFKKFNWKSSKMSEEKQERATNVIENMQVNK